VQLDRCPTNVTQCPNDARSDTDHLITADEVRPLAGGIKPLSFSISSDYADANSSHRSAVARSHRWR
jgi:hypothetical protein